MKGRMDDHDERQRQASKTKEALRRIGTARAPQGEREAFVRAEQAKRSQSSGDAADERSAFAWT
jgi:hypothetical protein